MERREKNVQECDATMLNAYSKAWLIKNFLFTIDHSPLTILLQIFIEPINVIRVLEFFVAWNVQAVILIGINDELCWHTITL